MKIAIIGGGSVGRALGRVWLKAGHEISYGLRSPQKDKHEGLPGERLDVGAAAETADVVVLAVPFSRIDSVAEALGPDFSRILIDCTNPTNDDFTALDPKGHASGAAYIKSKLPKARIVKSFNQTGADTMANAMYPQGRPLNFVCSNDEAAASCVRQLSEEVGLDTVMVRGIEYARQLEEMAWLWISLAMKQGHGRDFAFSMVRR